MYVGPLPESILPILQPVRSRIFAISVRETNRWSNHGVVGSRCRKDRRIPQSSGHPQTSDHEIFEGAPSPWWDSRIIQLGMLAAEIAFFDDNVEFVAGAREVGLQAHHCAGIGFLCSTLRQLGF